jgi:hypothetical protein
VVVTTKRGTKLHAAKTEFVAQPVCGLGEFFQFVATVGFEEVELFGAVRKGRKGNAKEADFAFSVAMFAEEFEENGEDVGIEPYGLRHSF